MLIEAVLFQLLQVLTQCPARHRHDIQMQHALDLFHDAGNTAGIVKILCGPVSGRTDIQQVMSAPVQAVKGICINLKTEFMGNGGDVHGGIGRAGNGCMHHDRIFKAFLRYDIRGFDPFCDQLHQLFSRIVGCLT